MAQQSQSSVPCVAADDVALAMDDLLERVLHIMETARARVVRQVNSEMVLAYWLIGREIVHALQGGEQRADYGSALLESVSRALTAQYGRGFSVTNLKYFRLFYQTYASRQPEISHEPRDQFATQPQEAPWDESGLALEHENSRMGFSPQLSWTHYRTLCRVESLPERLFYEIEAERGGWSQPVLMTLATQGQQVERPVDVIKHPYDWQSVAQFLTV